MVRPERFELPTPKFVAWCSIQLSYGRIAEAAHYAYRPIHRQVCFGWKNNVRTKTVKMAESKGAPSASRSTLRQGGRWYIGTAWLESLKVH